jgi:hypothetical protein
VLSLRSRVIASIGTEPWAAFHVDAVADWINMTGQRTWYLPARTSTCSTGTGPSGAPTAGPVRDEHARWAATRGWTLINGQTIASDRNVTATGDGTHR